MATFLPFAFDPDAGENGSLITHVARNNQQWCDPVTGEAMVIVHGAEHYVSPRWLPSLAEHGQVVPTWNYVTVRAAPTCSTRSHARTAAARQLEGLGRASAADVTDQWVVADMIRFMPPSARLPGTACGPTVQSSGRLPMTQL